MQAILKKIQEARPNLKEASLKTYTTKLRRLTGVLNEKPESLIGSLVNIHETMEKINKLNASAKSNMLSLILVLMDFYKGNPALYEKLYNFYLDEKKQSNKQYDGLRHNQQKTEKESAKWVELKELKKMPNYWKRRFIKVKSETHALFWLLASLYMTASYCPPRRNIFATVKYYDTEPANEKGNYFVRGPKAKFVYQDYKTVDKHGTVVIKLPKNSRILKAIDAYRNYNKSEYLLLFKTTRKPFTSDQMTKTLYQVFEPVGKGIGSSMLRKIYVSAKYEDDTHLKERQELAKKMGHSVNTQMVYYERK
jgi:integrase